MEKKKLCTIIVNPTSGRERAPRYLPLLHNVLSKKYEDLNVKLTEGPDEARRFARQAAEHNSDVVCMGGDGTINEVINGMVPVNSQSAFGFIPFGTVNDLARALGIPRSPKGAIRMLADSKIKNIDVGLINDRYFINIVAAGILPETMSQVSIKEKTLFGSMAYFMKAFQVLPKQKSYHFRIEDENGTVIEITSPMICGMLTDSAGSFRNLLPPDKRNQGMIKLALFRNFEWLSAIRQAPKLLAGLQMGEDLLTVIGIKKVHISIEDSDDELWTNVDGDKGPKFPIDLSILPGRLPVMVPREDRSSSDRFPHILQTMKKRLEGSSIEHEHDK
jgi:diacylglycerol kinase (ATP)